MVTLSWIQGDHRSWKQFVDNWVLEIQDITDPVCWIHCPGVLNHADLTI